jgi:hypothetical protein
MQPSVSFFLDDVLPLNVQYVLKVLAQLAHQWGNLQAAVAESFSGSCLR